MLFYYCKFFFEFFFNSMFFVYGKAITFRYYTWKLEASIVNKKLIHESPWRIVDKRGIEKGLKGVKKGQKDQTDGGREKTNSRRSWSAGWTGRSTDWMRVLFPSSFPPCLRSLFLAEQCAEKCAIGEKNGPLPLWSSGPLELFCFHLRKGASYRSNCAEWISERKKERQ